MMNVSPSAWRLPLCTGVALGTLWLAGCQACDVEVTHVDRTGQVEETVAELAISGMMCEIACVSKVRKLQETVPSQQVVSRFQVAMGDRGLL